MRLARKRSNNGISIHYQTDYFCFVENGILFFVRDLRTKNRIPYI